MLTGSPRKDKRAYEVSSRSCARLQQGVEQHKSCSAMAVSATLVKNHPSVFFCFLSISSQRRSKCSWTLLQLSGFVDSFHLQASKWKEDYKSAHREHSMTPYDCFSWCFRSQERPWCSTRSSIMYSLFNDKLR